MQNQSYAAQLLYQIAKEINKPPSTVDPYIQALENNWYDTKESMKDITQQTLAEMQIPLRLCQLILNKIQADNQTGEGQQPQQQQQQIQQQQPIQVPQQQSQQQQQKINLNDVKYALSKILSELKKETITKEKLDTCLTTISTILNNIKQNVNEEKYRKIKLQNQKFYQNVGQYNNAIDLLLQANFQLNKETGELIMSDVNVELLNFITIKLSEVINQDQQFNPYKSYIQTSADHGLTSLDVANKTHTSVNYVEKLEELKKQRDALIVPLTDRKVRILKVDPNKNFNQVIKQFDQEQQDNGYEIGSDPILSQALKDFMTHMEEQQHFTSRSKKEFLAMQQKPLFLETIIRIKFPNSLILEARFTPLERIYDVIQFVKNSLRDQDTPFYIFQSPPVQVMSEKYYQKTLRDMENVPSGVFYFNFQDQSKKCEDYGLFKQELEDQIKIL